MPERTLTVRIVGDDADLRRAFARSEKSAQTFQGRIQGATLGVSRGFIAAGVAAGATAISFQAVTRGIATSVSNASDLNEQISRTKVIMGDAANATLEWSRTTATAIGISQRQALAASATFAGLFQTVGVGQVQAGALSRELVQLAADLASLSNTSPEEALVALRSGLAGEAEPLRRFNIFLSETRVQQEALATTGKKTTSALTDQEKALARYNLILRDSAPAHGNFADTSGELANQTRILRANLDDLSTELGVILVPALTDAAGAANALFIALDQLRGVDFTPNFDFPDVPDFLKTAIAGLGVGALVGGPGVVLAGAGIKKFLDDQEKADKEANDAINRGGLGDERGTPEGRLAELARQRAEGARNAKRDLARSQQEFAAFAKGLGLKLDRAGLTQSLTDDIAVLRELERAILRQIEREGRTFKLVDQLVQTRLQISSLVAQNAQDAADSASDAWDETMDSLSLRLEVAQATKSFADDRAALAAIEQAILRRIEDEGRSTDLLRELFQARQEQAELRRQMAEEARTQREGEQFEAIGLTEEGDERAPGVGALQRRRQNLLEQIKGTVLDTAKTRSQLDAIRQVLAGKFGEVGRDVRNAILGMFNDIADALEEGSGTSGPLTKFQKTGANKLLEGLGLSEAEVKALRQRLAQVGPGGTVPGSGVGAFGMVLPPPGTSTTGGGGGITQIELQVFLDGKELSSVVTKRQQKKRGQGSASRRGVRPGEK